MGTLRDDVTHSIKMLFKNSGFTISSEGPKQVHGLHVKLALSEVVLGIAASFGLNCVIASFLFGVKPWDPAVFVSVPLILIAVALLAVWLPATRASKADPMQVLRAE